MADNQDIGHEYAGALQADRDAALERRYASMAAASEGSAPAAPLVPAPGAPPSTAEESSLLGSAAETAMKHASEIPSQFLFGAVSGVKEAASKVGVGDGESVGWDAETFTGSIARSAGQFMPGYLAASAALSALPASLAGAGLVAAAAKARPVVAGIVGGTMDFDHNEPRVSNLINDMGLGNAFTEWLAADPNDGMAEGTFKSAIENAGLGAATEGVVALARLNRARIVANRALEKAGTKTPEAAADEAARMVGDALDPVVDRKAAMGGDPAGEAVSLTRLADATNRAAATSGGEEAIADAVTQQPQSIYLNLARIDTADDVKGAIDTLASRDVEAINAARGGDAVGFTTAKGSTYIVGEGGRTTRTKAPRPEHSDFGPQPQSESTFYVTPEQANELGLFQTQGAKKSIERLDDGRWGVKYLDGKDAGRFERRTVVEPQSVPAVGLIPVEVWKAGQRAHFGNPITAVKTSTVQSFAEVSRLADEMGLDVNQILNRKRGPMGAAEAVAARKLMVSSGEQMVGFAKKAASADATPADLAAFQKSTAVHYALQTEVIAARTETARALASWRIPATGGQLRLSDVQGALQAAGGADKVREVAARMAALADNPAAMAQFTREGFRTGWKGRAFKQAWFNGLLSSPRTHVANTVDNALTAMMAVPERAATAAVSNAFGAGDVGFGEAEAMLWGMMRGTREGMKAAGKAFRTGEGSDLFTKIEANAPRAISAEAFGTNPDSAWGHAINAAGLAMDVPSRMLLSADEFFKSVGYRQELHALAHRQARGEGLAGRELAERMAQIVENPPDSLLEESINFGRTNTYTNKLGPAASKIAELRDAANIGGVPVGHFIAPFVRTPANIFRYSFERTPFAPLMKSVRDDVAAGGARREAALARIGMGSTVMLAAADMVAHGQMVGGGPGDPEMRAARERMGIPTYAVKVGGQWVSFDRLGYVGTLLGLAADAAELVGWGDFEDDEKTAASTALLFAKSLANKSYLQGVFEFASIIGEPENDRHASNFTQKIASSLVPFSGLLGSVKNAKDPIQRETQTAESDFLRETINRIRSRTPGLSESLPPARDLWGRPKRYTSNLGVAYDFAIPFRTTEEKTDPVDRAIIDNGIEIKMPDRSIGRVRLSGEEYSEYVRRAGETAKTLLDERVASPAFESLSDGPDGAKAAIVKQIVSATRDAARASMLRDFPDLAARVNAAQVARQQLLIGGPR
jgi:hypothetical protein